MKFESPKFEKFYRKLPKKSDGKEWSYYRHEKNHANNHCCVNFVSLPVIRWCRIKAVNCNIRIKWVFVHNKQSGKGIYTKAHIHRNLNMKMNLMK